MRFAAVDDAQRRYANDGYDLELTTDHLTAAEVDTSAEVRAEVAAADRLADVSVMSVRVDAVTGELVGAAHAAGLRVFVWTFRAQHGLMPEMPDVYRSCVSGSWECRRRRGDLAGWIGDVFVPLGVDGLMADEPNHTGLLP